MSERRYNTGKYIVAGSTLWRAVKKAAAQVRLWPAWKRGGRTQAFCPGCRNDLCSCPTTTCVDADLVHYVCGQCCASSSWDFDAPVPILVATDAARTEAAKGGG